MDDDGESVTLGFDASGLPAGVTVGSLRAAVVELEDNDERVVRVLPASLTVTEGGAAENYTVVLGSEPTASVTVTMTTDLADTSVRVNPASLTFTAANWSTAQTVAVRAVEDEDALAEPEVTLGHVASGGDYTGAPVSGVAVRVLETDVPTLSVANTPPAAVDAIGEQNLTVGGEAGRVDVSEAFADAEDDQLTYTAETGDAAVATVSVADTTVTVVPAGFGRTTVTVTASDSKAEATQQFVVVVGLVGSDYAVKPAADGGTVVVLTVPEAPTVRIEVAGGTEGLDTDGDGDVDEQDERPTVQAVSKAAVPAVPADLRVRVDTESVVDIEVPEQLTADGATVRVCLATSLEGGTLALYRYDAEAREWQRLESTVEKHGEQRFVCAEVGDFSVFAVFEDVVGADVNEDGKIDGDDALVMYYAYTLEHLLGNGTMGGEARRTLLAGRAGRADPSDADLMDMLLRAHAWRGAGADAGGDVNGDVNGDERIDGDDALVMYYAYTLRSLLGNGTTGGEARFRRTLLAGLAESSDPSDAELMAMLLMANDLMERLR